MRTGDIHLKRIASIQPGMVRPAEWIKPAHLILVSGKRLRRCMVVTVLSTWNCKLYLKVEEDKTSAEGTAKLPPGVYVDIRAGAQVKGFDGRALRPGIVDLYSIQRLCRHKRLKGQNEHFWQSFKKLLSALNTLCPWILPGCYEVIAIPFRGTKGSQDRGNQERLIRRPDYIAGGLTEGEQKLLETVTALWTARAERTGPIESDILIPAINNLYSTFGLPAPRIVFVGSPFALAVVGSFAVAWWHKNQNLCADGDQSGKPSDALVGEDMYEGSVGSAFQSVHDGVDNHTLALIEQALDKPRGRSIRRSFGGIAGGVIENTLTDVFNVSSRLVDMIGIRSMSDATEVRHSMPRTGAIAMNNNIAMSESIIETLADLFFQDSKIMRKFVRSGAGDCRQLLKIHNTQLFSEFLTKAITDVFSVTLGDPERFFAWQNVAANCGPILLHEKFCIVSDFPQAVGIDDQCRPHSNRGPSITYRDGWALYHWHGIRVPRRIVEQPETITVKEIRSVANLEVRRAMVELYGPKQFLLDCKAREIQRDECGVLYQAEIHPNLDPLVMVKVVNASKEPDGSFKDYFLRVPPSIRTARSGVAWTFGVSEEEYSPLRQT